MKGDDAVPDRTARVLAHFVEAPLPAVEALAVAAALARAVEGPHRAGEVHGGLHPGAVWLEEDGTVSLGPPPAGPADPLDPARLGALPFTAPEVLRGARPGRRSDTFAVAAIAHALLAGSAPFAAEEPLEIVRRVLHERPPRLRGLPRAVAAGVEAALAAGLAKRPWRRPRPGALAAALERAAGVGGEEAARAVVVRTTLRWGRAAAAFGVLAAAVVLAAVLGRSSLRERVEAHLARGELAEAREEIEAARPAPGDPVVEKLRGDLACAEGHATECLRRYRTALAARPELRADPFVRAHTVRLIEREHPCAVRRAAAQLLAQLRDPDALPALEQARRASGLLGFICTGDALDRAIQATRAEQRRAAR